MKNFNIKENFAAWTVIVVGVGVLGFFVLNFSGAFDFLKAGKVAQNSGKIKGSTVQNIQSQTNPDLDTDADGLTDILERKIGTDPHKADTDNDGYSDKEEVDTGHDPLVNAFKTKEIEAAQKDDPLFKISSGSIYPQPTESGLDTSSLKDAGSLGNLALLNTTIQNGNIELPEISDSSISISNNQGRAGVEEYLLSLFSVGLKSVPYPSQESFMAAFQAIQAGSSIEIDRALQAQGQAYEEIKRIPTPPEMIDFQKRVLATLQVSMESLEGIKAASTGDVARGLDAVSKMQVALINARSIADQLESFVIEYNLIIPNI